MQSITLKAPCKINLFLKVLDKRPDGYHNIETVFEKLDLSDSVTLLKKASGIKIKCDNPDVPINKGNICFKAMDLLKKDFNRIKGAQIMIKKNIPVAAGLGGGSSDAASVILGANRLWKLGLSQSRMIEYAKKLGADVPLFIKKDSFIKGEERGDKLSVIKTGRRFWHLLINPGFGLSTKYVYNYSKSYLTKKSKDINIIICAIKDGDESSLKVNLYNSLGDVVFRKSKVVKENFNKIRRVAGDCVGLSGSGPTLFTVHADRKSAQRLHKKLYRVIKANIVIARTL